MFKKVEAWFRSIISAELGKISTSLRNERNLLHGQLQELEESAKAHVQRTSLLIERLMKMLAAKDDVIAQLEYKLEHEWKAHPDTVASDNALRKAK